MSQQKTYPLWVSHTSIKDYLSCPRAYFLRNVYKDPKTGRKINVINPAMALGLAVHDTLESLLNFKAEERKNASLMEKFENVWEHVTGELGGFTSVMEEEVFKERGFRMIQRVTDNPGFILNKAVKLPSPDELPPRFLLSKEDNILLCGKVDWLEYFPEDDSVHIIDFKTGIREENEDSLQLAIYMLLVKNCQRRNIRKISYWYLEKDDMPVEKILPDLKESRKRILDIALQIKKLRAEGPPSHKATEGQSKFVCLRGGCYSCRPLENILAGKAKWIKTSGYMDVYVNV